jgi:hypothetical protein
MFEIDCFSRSLKRIASNCPNLRILKAGSVDIDSIFRFPKLESLCFDGNSRSTKYFNHQHLKNVCIRESNRGVTQFDSDLIRIVKCCVNLESLEISYELSKKTVEQLLRAAPRLKTLSLCGQAEDYVETIKEFGRHLDCFRCLIRSGHPPLTNAKSVKNNLKNHNL